ncbi:hypothetical protein [Nocardia wallacei]|uniref:hypothetical protein n=1 Tax=Nocardia wallacei TaxID=480035 RepID=UPI002456019F|nr:hypothetical protein [Nocardia wallacei]
MLADSYTKRVIEDRRRVAEYMRAGTPVFDVLEDVVDLVDGREWIRSGPSLISDGEWIWRVDSAFYLENYSLDIPQEFLDHVRRHDYRPASDVDVSDPSFDDAVAAYF